MFDTGKSIVMDIPGCEEGLNKLASFSEFLMKLLHFLMGVPELSI